MRRARRVATGLVAVAVLAALPGCGGDEAATQDTEGSATTAAPEWAAPLLSEEGPEAAAVLATSDFAVGPNRVGFLLVRDDGSLVRARSADVYYRPTPDGPTAHTVARLLPIGVGGAAADGEVKEIYVATVDLPSPGRHWVVIQPRGEAFQGFQMLDVKRSPTAVGVGERAPASRNPTSPPGRATAITTARPPDVELLRHSVADSLAAATPFVVAFSTPAYCQSRTCGPTLDVVEAVRRRFAKTDIRFIHVEIYEDNLPGNGVNRWVKEWRLPTEPWVFVVGREGVVLDRFEGAVSVEELARSVRRNLVTG